MFEFAYYIFQHWLTIVIESADLLLYIPRAAAALKFVSSYSSVCLLNNSKRQDAASKETQAL